MKAFLLQNDQEEDEKKAKQKNGVFDEISIS